MAPATAPDPLFRAPRRTEAPETLLPLIREAIEAAYPDTPPEAALVLCAQALHEGCAWNNNVGGLKRRPGQPYTSLRTVEVLPSGIAEAQVQMGRAEWAQGFDEPQGQRAVRFYAGTPAHHRATHFYSPDTLTEGVTAWLARVAERLRGPFPPTARELVARLKRAYYFTATEASYLRAVEAQLARLTQPGRAPETYGEALIDRVMWGE